MRTYVVTDASAREGGYVTERLAALGSEIIGLDRDELPPYAELEDPALVLLLGSDRGAHEPRWSDAVVAESALVRAALEDATPVMGICFGAQLMARALGGTSYRGDQPEVGWRRVETVDEVLCPVGPWAQFHRDVLTPPPRARVLGSSWAGPQCFIDDSHGARVIAWQFHPEVTPETFARWVDEDAETVREADVDAAQVKRQTLANAARSRNAAHRLVDDALAYLGVRPPAG